MSELINILKTLKTAFKELDSANEETQSDSSCLPKPVPAATMLEQIKNHQASKSTNNIVALKTPTESTPEFKMAARDGKEISSDILKRMKKNREQPKR
jgi:hypothetical protein